MAAAPPSGEEWAIENAGKGGLLLWPLFGATNQLLAGLSFLVITFYLWRRGKPVWFLVLPMLFICRRNLDESRVRGLRLCVAAKFAPHPVRELGEEIRAISDVACHASMLSSFRDELKFRRNNSCDLERRMERQRRAHASATGRQKAIAGARECHHQRAEFSAIAK